MVSVSGDITQALGEVSSEYSSRFAVFASDRLVAERRWIRNLRQYLGVYDPEVEATMDKNSSRAYPRVTRIKCVSVVSRLMNLMFPGNERNWSLQPSPIPDLPPEIVQQAFSRFLADQQTAGVSIQPTDEDLQRVVYDEAKRRAESLSLRIDDYLQELGGDQTQDYISLNRQVIFSGVLYGVGVLVGPFAIKQTQKRWGLDEFGYPQKYETTKYTPQFEAVSVFDYYPDMAAKNLRTADGYFVRRIVSRQDLRKFGERSGFYPDVISEYLRTSGKSGNYTPSSIDSELKNMGVSANSSTQSTDKGVAKFDVRTWYGPIAVKHLRKVQAEGFVDSDDLEDDDQIIGEVWMTGEKVIAVLVSPWVQMGLDVRTSHTFVFDDDPTSPVGSGLPNIVRDSQMSICASSRMLLDNASVVCGPNIELNLALLRKDQDLINIHSRKVWYRDEFEGAQSQLPAVRGISFDSHLQELLKIIELFMSFADAETFVGPATGGDMSRAPSEPLRTATGASILRGDAALPFKDIVRSFDSFTQSVIQSLVIFARVVGQHTEAEGDYNVVARGATSLMSKEIRGMQLDNLAATLRPEEGKHVNMRKMVEARFGVRDLEDMLLSEMHVKMNDAAAAQQAQQAQQVQSTMVEAQVRDLLASAFKSISQGQKNVAATEASRLKSVSDTMGALGGQSSGLGEIGQGDQTNTGGPPGVAAVG